jgi:maltose-binding protein MalE
MQMAQAFRTQAEQGQPMPNSIDRGIIDQELRFMQQQVLGGLANPTDAVSETDRRLRQRLQRST